MKLFTECGLKTALEKPKRLKKAQGIRNYQEILDLGYLVEAGWICKKAAGIFKKLSLNTRFKVYIV